MNEIMSEEAINELIDGFEIVGSLTEYGRKNIKYHFQRLQQENQQLKSVIKEIREYINKKLTDVNLRYGVDNEFREEYDDLLQIIDKTKDNE